MLAAHNIRLEMLFSVVTRFQVSCRITVQFGFEVWFDIGYEFHGADKIESH